MIARIRAMDPFRADVLLAALLGLEFQVEAAFVDVSGGDRVLLHLILLGAAVGLALRRRTALLGLTVVMGAFTALFAFPMTVSEHLYLPFFCVMFAAYSAGANTTGAALAASVGIVCGSITLASALDPYVEKASDWLFGAVVLGGGPLLAGRLIASRAGLHRALREKTARLEAARATHHEQAALEERSRIAGELEDVVAHALSAMVVQGAGARRLIARDPAAAEAAFAAVEATGREALDDLRRLLGVLRREDAELALAPQPSLAHLDDLARRSGAAGLPVEVHVLGAAPMMAPGVDVAAYRVVQEALAEARERGHAGRAEVRLRFADGALEIEVGDDGAPADDAHPRRLLGVRERVALLGGEMTSAVPRGGGHLVRARLPLRSVA